MWNRFGARENDVQLLLPVVHECSVGYDNLQDASHRRDDAKYDGQAKDHDSNPECGPVISAPSVPVPLCDPLGIGLVVGFLNGIQPALPEVVVSQFSASLRRLGKLDVDEILFTYSTNPSLGLQSRTGKKELDGCFGLVKQSIGKEAVRC